MDRLDQLFARSKREIEAHTDELGDTETGRYFIDEAAQLLAALRLWAQNQDRPITQFATSSSAATSSRCTTWPRTCERCNADGETAGWAVAGITNRSSGELMAVAAYALRAL